MEMGPLKASELVDNKVIWLLLKDNSFRFGRDNSISGILVNLLLYNRNSVKESTEDEANDLITLAASVSFSWLSFRCKISNPNRFTGVSSNARNWLDSVMLINLKSEEEGSPWKLANLSELNMYKLCNLFMSDMNAKSSCDKLQPSMFAPRTDSDDARNALLETLKLLFSTQAKSILVTRALLQKNSSI